MSEDDNSSESLQNNDDYYAFLNIPRKASNEEICNAYRKLSRLYHPDKHSDPVRKKEAEILFGKTKKAYEVLNDPHYRAIYDTLGVAGLNSQGFEVVHRTKTPQEIRDEYERFARKQEMLRLQECTNPGSSVAMTIDATDLFTSYDYYYQPTVYSEFGIPFIEIVSMSLSQSIEAPLTTTETAILSGDLSNNAESGSGHISCGIKKLTSDKGSGEVHLRAGNSGMALNLKGFRKFTQRIFGNVELLTQVSNGDLNYQANTTVANHLDKHTVGYLTWKAGMQNGMNTMIIKSTEKSNFTCSLYIGRPHSYISLAYSRRLVNRDAKIQLAGKLGTSGAMIKYGAVKKVSRHSHVSATMVVGVPIGVQLRLKLIRSSQTYRLEIMLCDDIVLAPIIYGTIIPIVSWLVIQKLIINPYLKKQKRDELHKQREANMSRVLEKQREAVAAIELMRETVRRIVETEESRKGLVILQALYGRLVTDEKDGDDDEAGDVIDVTIPLQCLVADSKLILQDCSKSQLPGFYDSCPGEDKNLSVKYLFRAVTHQATITDKESFMIPKQSHRVET